MIVFDKVQAIYGVSPSGKAAGFGPAIRRFESFHPSPSSTKCTENAPMVELVDTLVLETNALCLRVRVSLGAIHTSLNKKVVIRFKPSD
jgi:hypothetical protein